MIDRNEAQYGQAIPQRETKNLYPEQKRVEDPWVHRSEGMRCKKCVWFAPKRPNDEGLMSPRAYDVGRCRRHAPTIGGYPVVFVNDWCGDHRVDENKI